MVRLRFESLLAAPQSAVWAEVSTMEGVNVELAPWLRMSFPKDKVLLAESVVQPGKRLFQSWLCAFGLLPFDRHALSFDRWYPGLGFDERSSSWMQRQWVHRRRVEPAGEGTRVSDELEIEPRLPFLCGMVAMMVAALFRHRHRRLQHRFGRL